MSALEDIFFLVNFFHCYNIHSSRQHNISINRYIRDRGTLLWNLVLIFLEMRWSLNEKEDNIIPLNLVLSFMLIPVSRLGGTGNIL